MLEYECANKFLLLFVLNPLPYFFAFWFYTNSLSVPFVTGLVYLFVLLAKENNPVREYILKLVTIGFSFIGYRLRATNIFPLIAYIIYLTLKAIRKKSYKSLFVFLVLIIISFSLFVKLADSYERKFFPEEIQRNAYPITNWLVIGSTGHGLVSDAGEHFNRMSMCSNKEEMSEYCKEQLISNYKNLGVLGTIKLMGIKYAVTWSAGYSDINLRTETGETDSALSQWFTGEKNYLFRLYCNVFRALTFVGLFVFCIHGIKQSNYKCDSIVSILNFVVSVTIFGAMFFYLFWEAKTSYSFPFITLLIYIAQSGLTTVIQDADQFILKCENDKKTNSYLKIIMIVMLLFMIVTSMVIYKRKMPYDESRISAYEKNIQSVSVEGKDIRQTFYIKKDFNNIKLVTDYLGENHMSSEYDLKLLEGNNIIFERKINSEDIVDGFINIELPVVHVDGETIFSICLQKLDVDKDGLTFYSYDTNYFSTYRGTLNCDGKKYSSDLLMKISKCADN